MLIVSHRGNLDGPNPDKENHPDYIKEALKHGPVEIDIRIIDGKVFLGHDLPQYEIAYNFLNKDGLYIHCKTLDTVWWLEQNYCYLNYFWHETDRMTFTKYGDIWCYPGVYMKNGITVELNPEPHSWMHLKENYIKGICTDYVNIYRKELWL